MRTVKVEKSTLLEKLLENKKTHVEDFQIAWEAYHKAVISNCERILESAKTAPKWKPVQIQFGLSAPQNHEDDYQRAIEMLSWEIDDVVELTEQEFQQFVQDDWSWKGQFSASNRLYTGSESPSKIGI